jgi:hypothetical protein
MNLTPEQLKQNWDTLINYIETYISNPRKKHLLNFYNKFQDRLMFIPASGKKEYHNAFPGGYIDHINRVVECALKLHGVWTEMGSNSNTYSIEELVFAAINHDLGKLGDEYEDAYIPQTDQWRREKLGEDYMNNNKIAYASIPDRGLYLLQLHDIKYTFNEMVAIQTHDGLYDEGNKKYLMGYHADTKPRTNLIYILHQADMMASRIEFEKEYKFPSIKSPSEKLSSKKSDDNFSLVNSMQPKTSTSKSKEKALSTIKSDNLLDMLNKM